MRRRRADFSNTYLPDAQSVSPQLSGCVRVTHDHGAALQTHVELALVAAPNLCSPRDRLGADVANDLAAIRVYILDHHLRLNGMAIETQPYGKSRAPF